MKKQLTKREIILCVVGIVLIATTFIVPAIMSGMVYTPYIGYLYLWIAVSNVICVGGGVMIACAFARKRGENKLQ